MGKIVSRVERRPGITESPGTAYVANHQLSENLWFVFSPLSGATPTADKSELVLLVIIVHPSEF